MAGIKAGRVVTAGLLAGLVFNILDFAANTLLRSDWEAALARFNLPPASMETPSVMATWIAVDFLLGILIVWTYAAIRPRLGPGPRTAAVAGLIPFISVSLVLFGMSVSGIFPAALFWKSTAFSLITVLAGSLAGGWAYKEA
jgi:hypothetical protein